MRRVAEKLKEGNMNIQVNHLLYIPGPRGIVLS